MAIIFKSFSSHPNLEIIFCHLCVIIQNIIKVFYGLYKQNHISPIASVAKHSNNFYFN